MFFFIVVNNCISIFVCIDIIGYRVITLITYRVFLKKLRSSRFAIENNGDFMRTCMLIGIVVLSVLVMSCTNALQQFEHGRAAVTIGIAGAGLPAPLPAMDYPI